MAQLEFSKLDDTWRMIKNNVDFFCGFLQITQMLIKYHEHNRICLEYPGKIFGKKTGLLKIYSQKTKVTMVYLAHVMFNFVRSFTFYSVWRKHPLMAHAIYSTCTIDKMICTHLCFGQRNSSVSIQNSKQIYAFCYTNRLHQENMSV